MAIIVCHGLSLIDDYFYFRNLTHGAKFTPLKMNLAPSVPNIFLFECNHYLPWYLKTLLLCIAKVMGASPHFGMYSTLQQA